MLILGVFGRPAGIPGLGGANVSVFLGIACAVTCAGASVIGGDVVQARLFFPAAVSPQTSAVCAIVWVWVMYLASLGAVFPVRGFSLGLADGGGITACTVDLRLA